MAESEFYLHDDLQGYQRFDVPADLVLRNGRELGPGHWMELKPLNEEDIELASIESMPILRKMAEGEKTPPDPMPEDEGDKPAVTAEDPEADPTLKRDPPKTLQEAVRRLGPVHGPFAISRACRAWSFKANAKAKKSAPITKESCAKLPATVKTWAMQQIARLTIPLAEDVQDFTEPSSGQPSETGHQGGDEPSQT